MGDSKNCSKKNVSRSREEEDHPLKMPEGLRDGRDGIAFGNIIKIAEFHRDIFTQVLLLNFYKRYSCFFTLGTW